MKLALIGMMGTGKTAVGMQLAQRLGLSFADTDDIIVSRQGMSVAQVFLTYGEKAFRAFETSVLMELVWQDNLVISTGGGIVLDEANMDLLSEFMKIRLVASAETIYCRIKDDFSRPLIYDNTPPALNKIMNTREKLYTHYADITVYTDNKTVGEVVEELLRAKINRGSNPVAD